jgi:hypothetical protein
MSDHCCQQHGSGTHSPASEPCAGHPPRQPGGFGVENPRGLDALAVDGETGETVLIMVEPRAWDGSEERLFQLQEKINAYLSFALDGEMLDAFPHLDGKPLRLQLDCALPPDSMTDAFIARVREQIALQEIKFTVRIVGEPAPAGAATAEAGSCGAGCGCHPA